MTVDAVETMLKAVYAAAMKLSPEEMRELADKLEDRADSLRVVADDVESRNDNPDED